MAIIGYARVSSVGQSLDVQIEKLQNANCEKIFQEKRSGTNDDRPELARCLEYVRDGDTLVISRLDRMARSALHLYKVYELLESKGVSVLVLDQQIDTSTPTGRLMFGMLAVIAQFETELRKERQMDGIAKAKAKGVKFGRKSILTDELCAQIQSDRNTMTVPQIMELRKVSKSTVYRALQQELDTPTTTAFGDAVPFL